MKNMESIRKNSTSIRNSISSWKQMYFHQQPPQRRSGISAILRGMLEGWYRLTTPNEPSSTATIAQRERIRRGRLASILLFAALIYCLTRTSIDLCSRDFVSSSPFAFLSIACCILLLWNKRGYATSVGTAFIAMTQLYSFQIFIRPDGLSLSDLPSLDLLTLQNLLCITILPAFSVIIISLINSLAIWVLLTYGHHTQDLIMAFAAHQGNEIIARPIILNIVVALILYLWARNAVQALKRADRAESIAALEHTIAKQEHALVVEKEQLVKCIQLITETHKRVANGDESARVPIDDNYKLWPIAGMLNNLLSRLQMLRRDSYELARTRKEAERLAVILQEARMKKRPGRFATSGTTLDTVAVELVNQGLLYPPA